MTIENNIDPKVFNKDPISHSTDSSTYVTALNVTSGCGLVMLSGTGAAGTNHNIRVTVDGTVVDQNRRIGFGDLLTGPFYYYYSLSIKVEHLSSDGSTTLVLWISYSKY